MIRYLAILAFLGLAGCGTQPSNSDALVERLSTRSGPVVVPRFVELQRKGSPGMQLGIVESGVSGTVLLEQTRGAFKTWLTPDGATIVTKNGMLHGLKGLGAGLLASKTGESLALVQSGQSGTVTRLHSFLTGNDQAATRSFTCIVENKGPRNLAVGDKQIPIMLMQETCRNLSQSFFNLYWISNGDIVQSRQWSGDFLGAISMRELPNSI